MAGVGEVKWEEGKSERGQAGGRLWRVLYALDFILLRRESLGEF